MESHSQYLALRPLLFMTEVSLHAFKVLFVLIFRYYCLYPKVSNSKKIKTICERIKERFVKITANTDTRCFIINKIKNWPKCSINTSQFTIYVNIVIVGS